MPRLDPVTGLKECSKCKGVMTEDAFCKNKLASDGLSYWCRRCQGSYVKTTYINERAETGEKTCNKCGNTLPVQSFPSNKRRKDGLDGWCSECASENARSYYVRRSNADPRYIMLMSCRARAKKKGLPCTVVDEDIDIPENCPVCGCLLIRGTGTGGKCSSSPSLDMWDPTIGYVPGNVWVICDRCNMRKQDMSGEDHVAYGWKLIDAFKEYRERMAQLPSSG